MDRRTVIREIVEREIRTLNDKTQEARLLEHCNGVAVLAEYLGRKKGMNGELLWIAGWLHDIGRIEGKCQDFHAQRGGEKARIVLGKTKCFTNEETTLLVQCISNHSSKENIDDEYSEVLKNADTLEWYFYTASSDRVYTTGQTKRIEKLSNI